MKSTDIFCILIILKILFLSNVSGRVIIRTPEMLSALFVSKTIINK